MFFAWFCASCFLNFRKTSGNLDHASRLLCLFRLLLNAGIARSIERSRGSWIGSFAFRQSPNQIPAGTGWLVQMKNIAILKQRFGEVSQSVPISEGLRFGKDSKQRKQWWTVFFGCLGLALMAWEALSNQLMHLLWILLSRYLSSYLYVVLVTAIITCSSSFSTYLVYISSLALLKMLKHGRAGVPMEVMGLMPGEFVDEYTGEVEICPLYPPIYSGLVLDNRLVSWNEIILLIFADLSLDIFT